MHKHKTQYSDSLLKRSVDITLSIILLILLIPLFIPICYLIYIEKEGSIIFFQKRTGKNGKEFVLYKFRTMVNDAEKLKDKYSKLNEADGPVFKIKDDPRFTRLGKYLSGTGLDEIPQLLNVLKGDMSIVGPRPLPTYESKMLSKKEGLRLSVRPGITSSWIIKGGHNLTFKEWMKLDEKYVLTASLGEDLRIIKETFNLVLKLINKKIFYKSKSKNN